MTTIRKTIHLAVPPARVWAYLTEAKELAKWFHPADGDLSEGLCLVGRVRRAFMHGQSHGNATVSAALDEFYGTPHERADD